MAPPLPRPLSEVVTEVLTLVTARARLGSREVAVRDLRADTRLTEVQLLLALSILTTEGVIDCCPDLRTPTAVSILRVAGSKASAGHGARQSASGSGP
jgi:hypothetical protein